MIANHAKTYVLTEGDISTIDAVLMGLRTALNAIVVARTIDPKAPPRSPSEVRRFDQLVDQVLQERGPDMTRLPDVF
jgi:hypothetical protein